MTSLLLLLALAQAPGLLGPLEEALDNLSLGPSVSAHLMLDSGGFAPGFAAGLQLISFEIEKTYDARCVEHRERERAQLGANEGGILDDALSAAQQECRATSESVHLGFAVGLELEVAVRAQRELSLRGWGTIFKIYRALGLGTSTRLVFADRPSGTALGLRFGLELSWSQRFGHKGFRPVLQPFIRGEVTLLGRDQLTDGVSGGVRFLFDI